MEVLGKPVDHPSPVVQEVDCCAGSTCAVPSGRVVGPDDLLPETPQGVVHLTLIRGGNVPFSFAAEHEQRCFDPIRDITAECSTYLCGCSRSVAPIDR